MANKLKAINAYRPKIDRQTSVGMKDLVELIGSRTGLNKGEILIVLSELSEVVQFFCKRGQGVKLDGLGTYLPIIKTRGYFTISHRLASDIKNTLNSPGEFRGKIINRENIGKTMQELIEQWNAENPEDLVEVEA